MSITTAVMLAASGARRAGPFDPSSTLSWAVPLILLAPLIIFLMLAIGVRGRRATANVAIVGPLLGLVGVFFAEWALLNRSAPYDVTYPWLDLPLSVSGASQFQTYSMAMGIRATHASLLLAAAALLIGLLTLAWSRIGARGGPGPARYYGAFALLVFAAVGVVVSTDYLALVTFWGIAGVSTYLLMTHHWSDEAATRSARLGLAVPALTDLSLLAGVAILYSRYGQTSIDGLIPILHHTPGAGNRALLVATLLIFAGVAGRAGLFPFHGWLTATPEVPPAAAAAIQGLWPLIVTSLLYKSLPLLVSAGSWPLRIVAVSAALSAIAVPLIGLAGLDIRRVVTAAGIGLTSLAILAFARPGIVGLAIVAGAGSGLARAGLVLAAATLVIGMRAVSLRLMGDGLRRMPLAVSGLLAGAVGLAFLTVEPASEGLKPQWYAAYALGGILVPLGLFRAWFGAALAPLAPRRGFDPNRIRESSRSLTLPSLVLGLAALGLALAAFSTRFLTYVDGKAHTHPSAAGQVLWLLIPLLGVAVAFLLLRRREIGDRVFGLAAEGWAVVLTFSTIVGRLLVNPVLRVAGRAEEMGETRGERALGRLLAEASTLSRVRAPFLLLSAVIAIVAVLVAGLLVPGVQR